MVTIFVPQLHCYGLDTKCSRAVETVLETVGGGALGEEVGQYRGKACSCPVSCPWSLSTSLPPVCQDMSSFC